MTGQLNDLKYSFMIDHRAAESKYLAPLKQSILLFQTGSYFYLLQ